MEQKIGQLNAISGGGSSVSSDGPPPPTPIPLYLGGRSYSFSTVGGEKKREAPKPDWLIQQEKEEAQRLKGLKKGKANPYMKFMRMMEKKKGAR